jgi:hypothetical protein
MLSSMIWLLFKKFIKPNIQYLTNVLALFLTHSAGKGGGDVTFSYPVLNYDYYLSPRPVEKNAETRAY